MHIRSLLICAGCLTFLLPAHAQGWKKLPGAFEAQSKAAGAPLCAYENALRHAQALQQIRLATEQAALTATAPDVLPATSTQKQRFRRTPQDWLEMLEKFTKNTGRYPSYTRPYEKSLCQGLHNLLSRLDPQDPTALRVRQLREQYSSSSGRPGKSTQEWLTELEAYIAQTGKFPTPSTARTLYVGVSTFLYRQDSQDPAVLRIRQLREQYPTPPRGKSAQEWLTELEDFTAQYQRYPSSYFKDEQPLHSGIYQLQKRLPPDDPVASRIAQIQEQYPVALNHRPGKSPQQWLAELEAFVQENQAFPSPRIGDPAQKELYSGVFNVLSRIPADDPVAIRMRELRAQYPSPLQKK